MFGDTPAATVRDSLSVIGGLTTLAVVVPPYRSPATVVVKIRSQVSDQETEALFATLRRLTESGLSALFISHKMSEVLAVSDRVVVLRDGRVMASRETAATDRGELA